MPTHRLHSPTSVLVGGLALVLAPGALALPTLTGSAGSASRAADADVKVVELDLTGVAHGELSDLPDVPPMPGESTVTTPSATPADGLAEFGRTSARQAPAGTARGTAAVLTTASLVEPSPEAAPTASPTVGPTASPIPADAGTPAPAIPTPTPSGPGTAGPDPEATGTATEPVPDVLTGQMSTAQFSVLGLSWDDSADGVVVRYRVRADGGWTPWEAVAASDVAPDRGGADDHGSSRQAADAVVALGADGLQVWADAAEGTVTGLKAVLVDPGTDSGDAQIPTPSLPTGGFATSALPGTAGPGGTAHVEQARLTTTTSTGSGLGASRAAAALATATYPAPGVVTRAQWGADESLRTCDPDLSTSMVSAAIHHTASTNDYTAADVPGLLRGFLAYHTRPEADGGRGWCDIGYNFLVDRFGRVFEGRAGSIDKTVVGVHTGGFNSRTVGIAAIGEYGATGAPVAMLEAISQTVAWKFSELRISAGGTATMVSGGGASKYPEGTVVTFPTIYGHRDAQLTSCPGQFLYDTLPAIRNRVAQLVDAGVAVSPFGFWERTTVTRESVEVAGWLHDPDTRSPIRLAIELDGRRTEAVADGARPDVAAAVPTAGPAHGFDVRLTLPYGRHVLCLWALNTAGGYDALQGCRYVTGTNPPPIGVVDEMSTTADSITVRGWALDPDTTEPIGVHVYVDGVGRALVADQSRPDVGAAYGKGDRHGFTTRIPAAGGPHQVCAYAINTPAGDNSTLGCRTVVVENLVPLGRVDEVTGTLAGVTVRGWALDPDTTDPIAVHLYLDGAGRAVAADQFRWDIAAAFGRGERHGFTSTLPAAEGPHTVCAYAINSPAGVNTTLGCTAVTVANATPIGNLEGVTASAGRVTVSGWALDPDTWDPIGVHVYVDGVGRALVADIPRGDVLGAYAKGAAHGFAATVATGSGAHQVCVYAINVPAGANATLGCRTVNT